MSNSSLATYQCWSPNYSSRNGSKITHIVIHHTAFVCDIKTLGNVFLPISRQASSTYGIGNDGTIGQFVDEAYRPWTTSNWIIDQKAITIEVSNSAAGGDWPVGERAMDALVKLCADICERNGIEKLYFDGTKEGSNLHAHKWYASTACPGPYLYSKFPEICERVNRLLDGATSKPSPIPSGNIYRVQVGAFRLKGNAEKLAKELKDKGYSNIIKQVGNLYKVQCGAFGVKENADKLLAELQGKGYSAIIAEDEHTSTSLAQYTDEQLAQMVWQGKFGSGAARIQALGSRYAAVQALVNKGIGR